MASLVGLATFSFFRGAFICYDTKDDITRDRVLFRLWLQALPLHVSFSVEDKGE